MNNISKESLTRKASVGARQVRRRTMLLFLIALAGLAGWRWVASREPVYQGRPVSKWVSQLQFTPLGQTNPVFDVLLDIGPDCLPALAEELKRKDGFFRRAWRGCWHRLPLRLRMVLPIPIPAAEPAARRTTAAWALGQIGPAAAPTIRALTTTLRDAEDKVREQAALSLRFVSVGADPVDVAQAVAGLARCLGDPSPRVRERAAEALMDMAPASEAALPALFQLLRDSQHAYLAAICLRELGPRASNAVPDLVQLVRFGQLGRTPGPTADSGRMIRANGEDPTAHTRAMAARALGRIGVASPEVLSALQDALGYPPDLTGVPKQLRRWVGENAARALGELGTNALSTLPALVDSLGDTNPPAMQEAALALGAMGAHAQVALPVLTNLLARLPEPLGGQWGVPTERKFELFWLRGAVARAVSQIDPSNDAARAVLLEHMDSDAFARQRLEELGASANKLVPKLTELLARASGQPRIARAELLWHFDPKNPAIIPALTQGMSESNSAVRAVAAYWYWKVTGEAETPIRVLLAGLHEPPGPASQMFPIWLEKMGPAAESATPELRRALWHHDAFARRNAQKALRAIDPATAP
jgi:HEAT repeat protein